MENYRIINKQVSGIGDIEISVLQTGDTWHLLQLENLICNSDEPFYALSRMKSEISGPKCFERVLQCFINHIQSGGEKQAAPLMRIHFRNWVNRQNGTLKLIANGQQSVDSGDKSVGAASRNKINALRDY